MGLPLAYRVLCVYFTLLLPASAQHSIWVVGWTFPNKDFHLVRGDKLLGVLTVIVLNRCAVAFSRMN